MRGLITASLKDFGKYPNDNDELIVKRGSITLTESKVMDRQIVD